MDKSSSGKAAPRRAPLTRERVLQAAVELVDRSGLSSLTMRRLGSLLGVEAMALYRHVSNKDEILDGIVEMVVGEIETPTLGAEWRTAMRQRAGSARDVLRRHPWAIGLMESRGVSRPSTLRYLDAVIGSLRAGGFSVEMAAHAFWLLDSFVYGQVIQELSLAVESDGPQAASSVSDDPEEVDMSDYPNFAEVAASAVGSAYSVDTEFEFGLELILDALDRLKARESGS